MSPNLVLRRIPAARLFGLFSIAAVLAVVELLLHLGVLNRYIMPLPSQILGSFGRVIAEEHLLQRFLQTGGEALATAALITGIGIPVGVALYRWPVLRSATETWVAAFAAAPLVLAYPLFLVIFGRSAATIVAMGAASGLAPVILKTVEGLNGVPRVLLDVGRSLKLRPMQQFWRIQFPAAVPTIFAGLRLGLIFALINIVGIEFLINFGGLGQLINELAERYDLPGTYAAICFVVLVSVCFFIAMERIEAWLRPAS